ncbi:MAG: hypothetical protein ACREMG_06100, partial [Gemmatimonadales bacterium]
MRGPGVAFDWLIRGGTVLDGTGGPGQPADVGLTGDRVVAIAPGLEGEAGRVVVLWVAWSRPVSSTTIGSDNLGLCAGPEEAHVGTPHPRQHGCFAKVLGTYVRERGVLSWEAAVHK